MDWSRWRGSGLGSALSPRFLKLCKEAESGKDGQTPDGAAIRKALLAAAPDQRKELLLSFLRDKVARVLGSTPDKVDFAKPLTDLGLDSLMAVELRNWIEGELRINLPIVELMQGPSVDRLAELVLEQLTKADTAPSTPAAKPAAPAAPALPAPVEQPAAPVSSTANGLAETTNGHAGGVDAAQAEELLAKVDEMSNEEVDALLATMMDEKEEAK
jgi:acyl carrier protein